MNNSDSSTHTVRALPVGLVALLLFGAAPAVRAADPPAESPLLSKVASRQPITGQDDPELVKFGETLVRFLRERDPAIFEQDAYLTSDLVWAFIQKSGRPGPSREQLDAELNRRSKEQLDLARGVVKLMEDAGVDLKKADIKIEEVSLERAQSPGAPGSTEGLMGSQFRLKLAVKSDEKAKSGSSLSGEYILAANQVMRFASGWRVMDNFHWQQLPDGAVDPEVLARLNFENYVAQHGTLPPKAPVPEIDFITLEGEKQMKLSDLKGKVVVLDFWATWCGPCQQPMAELQQLRSEHPDWKDRVAIVPLSIDDTFDAVRKHVDKRGWTNTFNVWAGEGGWSSKPAVAFHVKGVPTTYVIDAAGEVVQAGHPAAMRLGDIVDGLLRK